MTKWVFWVLQMRMLRRDCANLVSLYSEMDSATSAATN